MLRVVIAYYKETLVDICYTTTYTATQALELKCTFITTIFLLLSLKHRSDNVNTGAQIHSMASFSCIEETGVKYGLCFHACVLLKMVLQNGRTKTGCRCQ